MFNALGFGLASAVLLVTFGKLITDSSFSYLIVAIIQFEVVMFWLGLKRPLGTENNDRYLDNVDSNPEQFRHDASGEKSSRPTKKHSKWIELDSYLKRFVSRYIFLLEIRRFATGNVFWIVTWNCLATWNDLYLKCDFDFNWVFRDLTWSELAPNGFFRALKAAVITLHRCFDSSLQ